MSKFLIVMLLVFGLQTDWLSETKKLISKTDENAVLIHTEIEDDKGLKAITTVFKAGEIQKIKVEFSHSQLMDIELNLFEKNGFILGEIINGKDFLIHKRKPLENEPYATLVESRTYFKNKTEGINLIREINIYKTDKIEDVKKKLDKLEFKTKNLNAADYIRLKEKFDRITKNKRSPQL